MTGGYGGQDGGQESYGLQACYLTFKKDPKSKIRNPKSKINRANRGVGPSAFAKTSGFALQASIFTFGYAVTSRRYKTVGQAHSQVLVYSLIKNI
jgi:hypothetical protein